jgi:electron transport complex protein RnfD
MSAPELLHNACAPHLRSADSVSSIMLTTIVALLPAAAASVVFFGVRSVLLILICTAAAMLAEWCIASFLVKQPRAMRDGSAAVTGLMLALTLPPRLPFWMAALGAVVAIAIVKWPFGGLGGNLVNPALAGRAFLMISFPAAMTAFIAPVAGTINGLAGGLDGIAAATPLACLRQSVHAGAFEPLVFQDAFVNMFLGNTGGCLGETSALALLAGAIILWYRQIIGIRIPFFFVLTVFILFWIFNGTGGILTSEAVIIPVYQVLGGGLLLGAIFMANDPVTSPVTSWGKILFGAGCGALTFLFRKFGSHAEGVMYAILLMNLTVPLFDRWLRPGAFTRKKRHA